MHKVIADTFGEMVLEIQKTYIDDIEPNRYHKTASISEVNLVYHFTKQLEKKTKNCIVYLEFPCDSGRVDAVVLYENNILLIEAKTNMDNKKYKVLDAQAVRFENVTVDKDILFNVETWVEKYYKDSSLRDTLKERVGNLMMKKWRARGNINIYGILLADALSAYQKDKWDYKSNQKYYTDNNLNCMKKYTLLGILENSNNGVWYLGKYNKVGTLDF